MSQRPPAVAGMFYPKDPVRLRQGVLHYLDQAREGLVAGQTGVETHTPKAVIVPHAGYVYSGPMAGVAYHRLESEADRVRHVILVGPAHRVGIHGIALAEVDGFTTPLGDVPVWAEGIQIALDQPSVVNAGQVHAQEHSLEVQLPFLQVVLPQADILPLAVSWVEPSALTHVLDCLWGCDETIIVISSDLSHYLPYAQAQGVDQMTVGQILTLDSQITHEQACGATGISAMCLAAKARGLTPHLLGLCNSGDTAGDEDQVVGYTAIAFVEPNPSLEQSGGSS